MPATKPRRTRQLPDPPSNLTPDDPRLVAWLLEQYVEGLPDEFDINTVANDFRLALEAEYPEAWDNYLEVHWTAHFSGMIRAVLGAQKQRARRQARMDTTRARVSERESTGVATTSYSTGSGVFRRLSAMTRPDLMVAVDRHEKIGQTNLIQAKFLRRVADRLKNDTEVVADRWSEADLQKESNLLNLPAEEVVP